MAITYRGVSNAAGQASGSVGASTVSITPTLPGSTAAGDRVYVYAVGTTTSGTTPTNWTVIGTKDTTLGSGAAAAGTGLRRATWYYRDYDGVWSMPAFTLTSTANNSHWIGAVSLTPTLGFGFATPTITTVGGSFNAATTSYTDTSAASFTTTTNGFLLIGTGLNDNAASSAAALSQSGATFGTVTERADGGTGTGFTVAGQIHTTTVTTGAAATTTFTQTIASSQGETLIVQQTETASISRLVENFNNGYNATNWTKVGTNTANVNVVRNRLEVATTTAADENALASATTWNLTGSAIYVRCIDPGVVANENECWFRLFITDFSNSISMIVVGFPTPRLEAYKIVASSGATVATTTYNATNHRWWRIRESAGLVYWDHSPDGVTWNNFTSLANPINVSALSVRLQADNFAVTTARTAIFDNVNFLPNDAENQQLSVSVRRAGFY